MVTVRGGYFGELEGEVWILFLKISIINVGGGGGIIIMVVFIVSRKLIDLVIKLVVLIL